MLTRKIGIFVILLCICFQLMPICAQTVSTSDALEPIIPDQECSLTVSFCYGQTAFANAQVKLYRIAEVSADFQYTLISSFETSGLILNGIQSNGEWNVVRSTLEAYILAYGVQPDAVTTTDENGQVYFEALPTGLYLVTIGQVVQDELHFRFDSALVALPGLGQDGYWQYQVAVNAKGEVLPPVDPDEEKELKVLKLWKGDEGRTDRPPSVEVEIFRNGTSYETVILSEQNHWAYSWTVKDDGAAWTVIERNIPEGYTMTVETRESSFVLTNTWPTIPEEPPKAGDTTTIMFYVVLMIISGAMLVVLGLMRKRTV